MTFIDDQYYDNKKMINRIPSLIFIKANKLYQMNVRRETDFVHAGFLVV